MKKIIHWIVSIAAAAVLSAVTVLAVAGLGYTIYLLATEFTVTAIIGVIIAIAYWVGSYIENHGWAWCPHDDSAE